MKLLKAGDVGPLFNNPQLWTPTAGRSLHYLVAVALPTMLLLGSASNLASANVGVGAPGTCNAAGLAGKLLQGISKVAGRRDS
jgi:hypothetical protein